MKELVWAASTAVFCAACHTADSTAREAKPQVPVENVHEAGALTLERIFELAPKLRLTDAAFGGWTGAAHEHFATQGSGEQAKLVVVDAASGNSRPFHDVARMEAALAQIEGIEAEKAWELAHRTRFELSKDARVALFNEHQDLFTYHFES